MTALSNDAAAVLGDRGRIEEFLIREVRLLDDRRFEEWRDLFDEDGYYWVPLRPDQTDPEAEASLFYDDRKIMQTRFERLRHPRIHSQTPPHRTCHIIGNILIEEIDRDTAACIVSSSMIMVDYRQGVKRVFAGRATHRLHWNGERFMIASKRVDLIDCDDVFELIAVPF